MTNNINIVGGAYFEECCYPRRQLFRGSGVRAAVLLNDLGCAIKLNTACGDFACEFKDLSDHLGFQLSFVPKDKDISFRYQHPLAIPNIINIPNEPIIYSETIQSELALVFGMLEGRPKVNANKVVYDPQDGINSTHFSSNGSVANELAIVVSYSEGKKLSGMNSPEDIAKYLLDQPNVAAVIVKCGALGAIVSTNNASEWIPLFPTKRVFKIGSGDVFTSTFAYEWLLQGTCPLIAGWIASRVTAEYVETGLDRISLSRYMDLKSEALNKRKHHPKHVSHSIPSTQIYLAGPFFNTAEQWRIDEAKRILEEMGFTVFSPIHEVGEGDMYDVAQADLKGLEDSDVILAILDGLDCGTVFEIGYARALKKPVVVIAEHVDSRHLTMICGSDCDVTDDFTAGIYNAGWKVMNRYYE
ncbi:PfkB family carbohydrate kinase [Vibrio mimicus]|uniref:PfkB family carbohydrate kinase n=1 Tax=Vibrio mimicus TaxID=674 RepID=UPI002F946BD1|nr:nucleoside 2-deoxyribosyltransferase [Vibrio cholerae]